MTVLATPAVLTGRRQPALDHQAAMRLAATEYERFLAQLRGLSDADWSRPTVCSAWDVRAMAGHVLGMAEMAGSMRENMRQVRIAKRTVKRDGGFFIDALTSLQVTEHAGLSAAEVVEAFATAGPAAARGRRRTPALMRRLPMGDQPIDETGTNVESWSVGYLTEVVLTRDTWMHRSDIAEAVGQPMELSPEHDGALIADVAAEWAARHGQPCTLRLTGPAGGSWSWGSGGPVLELDAVPFCRVISGRDSGDGLLATRVPF
jgi:uncharacterized protein (TIGR03083 family)